MGNLTHNALATHSFSDYVPWAHPTETAVQDATPTESYGNFGLTMRGAVAQPDRSQSPDSSGPSNSTWCAALARPAPLARWSVPVETGRSRPGPVSRIRTARRGPVTRQAPPRGALVAAVVALLGRRLGSLSVRDARSPSQARS